ncbi:hypothetical protein ACVWYG_001311 [Pedobacter sp. UYEF25]
MQNLSFSIIVIPAVAVLSDILLYAVLMRKSTQKKIFRMYVFVLLPIAFLLNAIWEVLQIPLYAGGTYSWAHILFCLLASVADAIMVLLIYFALALVYRKPLWIQNLTPNGIVSLILAGFIGAVLAETRHLSIGTWRYADIMPVIPILNVGLSPVVQFMILPLLIYTLSLKMTKRSCS